jgi:cobalt/nickel transport system permease protein
MFAFTYRYIFVLDDEFVRMERSLASRGFKRRGNLYTITTISKAIAMLFVNSYGRADRVFYAMRSKGYSGTVATLHEFHARRQDWVNTAVVPRPKAGLGQHGSRRRVRASPAGSSNI